MLQQPSGLASAPSNERLGLLAHTVGPSSASATLERYLAAAAITAPPRPSRVWSSPSSQPSPPQQVGTPVILRNSILAENRQTARPPAMVESPLDRYEALLAECESECGERLGACKRPPAADDKVSAAPECATHEMTTTSNHPRQRPALSYDVVAERTIKGEGGECRLAPVPTEGRGDGGDDGAQLRAKATLKDQNDSTRRKLAVLRRRLPR